MSGGQTYPSGIDLLHSRVRRPWKQQHNSEGTNDAYRHPNVPHFDQSSGQFCRNRKSSHRTQALPPEWKWRRPERSVGAATEDISISRWTDAQDMTRHAEATTPANRYFIAIALKATRLKLTRGQPNHIRRHYADGHAVCRRAVEAAQCAVPCAVRLPALPRFAKLLSIAAIGDAAPRDGRTERPRSVARSIRRATGKGADRARQFGRSRNLRNASVKRWRCILRGSNSRQPRSMPCRNGVSGASRNTSRRISTAASACQIFAKVAGLSRMHFAAQFPRCDGIPSARISPASAHRAREIAAVEYRDAAGRGRAGRRLLHAGAFLDRLQAYDGRNAGAVAMRQAERIAFGPKHSRKERASSGNNWNCAVSARPRESCEMGNSMDSRNTLYA